MGFVVFSSKGDAMDVTDIRAMLTGYVKDNGLASLSDKRYFH